jgi:aminoglycoside phosphotransferase (APT) family kinase protein
MTTPPWTADIHVDVALASALIRSQFHDIQARSATAFGNGWDNTAFLVDGTLLVRFPRRAAFAYLIETEVAVLPLIAAAVPLAITAPTHVGRPTDIYPYTFAGYPLIAGQTAITAALSDRQRADLAVPLAHFLRTLHAIPTGALVARGLRTDDMGRLDHAKRRALMQARLETLAGHGVDEGPEFMAWMDAHPPQAPEPGALRVVHGDLYAQHIVLDDERQPVGIIDWGDVHLGDPAIDLAVAHQVLPLAAHERFLQTYGPVDERMWNAARYRAIYHALIELEYGIAENDAAMRDAGRSALEMIRPQLRY